MGRIVEYKCVICGRKVQGRTASPDMKEERVCLNCLMEYVWKKEGANNEDKMD